MVANNLEMVRAFLKLHKKEIMQRYQAHGVGIGKQHPEDHNYVIVVYLNTQQQKPLEPVILEDIPLKFEVTGPFTLQQ